MRKWFLVNRGRPISFTRFIISCDMLPCRNSGRQYQSVGRSPKTVRLLWYYRERNVIGTEEFVMKIASEMAASPTLCSLWG